MKMDLKITEKKEEPLLSRITILADISFDAATPAKKDIQASVASAQKVSENLIVVKSIYTVYGHKTAKVVCYQYEDEKKLKLIEPKEKAKTDKPKEEKAEKKEEKKEAKPAPKKEEKKEEPKKEAKK